VQVTLYGLLIVPRRRVNYGPIDPVLSRELFIRHALVEGEYATNAPFFAHNRELLEEVALLEAKSRRRDILVDEETLFAFYDERLPPDIYSGKAFEKWRKQAERGNPRLLYLERESLMRHGAEGITGKQFPERFDYQGLALPLEYHFEPGHPADGVTLLLPLAVLAQLKPASFEWLVPGLLKEKLIAMIKALPKAQRRNFVPAVNFAEAALEAMAPGKGTLREAFSLQLQRITGIRLAPESWQMEGLPPHLLMNFRVVDEQGRVLGEGRDLVQLQRQMAGEVRESLQGAGDNPWERAASCPRRSRCSSTGLRSRPSRHWPTRARRWRCGCSKAAKRRMRRTARVSPACSRCRTMTRSSTCRRTCPTARVCACTMSRSASARS
jgi:ATP-dependent helicase HrpA